VLENSILLILALFLVGATVGMLCFRQVAYSAFSFLVAMLALAGLFALLENTFLFVAQIMVSVGAVIVLSLMVIVTLNIREEHLPDEPFKWRWMLLSLLLVSPFSLLMYKALTHLHRTFEVSKEGYGTLKLMGGELFENWVLPFEIVSVLLLVAMVAAIVIARKESA
jgi:NADH-quinone oxidoreductase subunit J